MDTSFYDFSRLVAGIHESATNPVRWEFTLAELAESFGSRTVSLLSGDREKRQARMRNHGADPASTKSYNDHYGTVDFVAKAIETSPIGAIRTGTELIEPNQKTEFYADWIRPNELDDGLFTRLNSGGGVASWLVVAAPKRRAPFSTPDRVHLLRHLIPHIQQAVRTQMLFGTLCAERAFARELLELMPYAAAVLSSNGEIQQHNARAATLLAHDDGLYRDCRGVLHAAAPCDNADLQRMIGNASRGQVPSGGCMAIRRRSSRPPYVAHVVPLSAGSLGISGRAALIAFIDPDRPAATTVDVLRSLYGLTRAETAVAERIKRGEGLSAIADALAISMATARTHLQHVFHKTGTHRQSELVSLLINVQPIAAQSRVGDSGPSHRFG